jgi:hypothetical protein
MLGYLTDAAGLTLFQKVAAAVFNGEPNYDYSGAFLYTGDIPTDGTGAPTGTLLGSGAAAHTGVAAATTDTYKNTAVYKYSVNVTADGTVGYVAIAQAGSSNAPKSGDSVMFLTVGDSSSSAECIIDKTNVSNGDTVTITINANMF